MMSVARLRPLLLGLFLVGGSDAGAGCRITGLVMSLSGPLSGVRVSERRGSLARQTDVSGPDGRFAFDVDALPADLRRLPLSFEKEGFEPVDRLLKPGAADGCPVLQPDRIQMEPVAGSAAPDASVTGNTLFVATRSLYPEQHPDIEIARKISERFGDILYHYISSYISSLALGAGYEFGFRHLDKPLRLSDLELIRKEGRERNALAVIAGEGQVVETGSQGQRFDLVSGFRIIPVLPGYQERHLHLQDSLPLRDASAFNISLDLRDLWGQKTVVALVVRDLAEMSLPYDKARLLDARSTLLKVEKTISEEDAIYREVHALLVVIEKELGW